MDCLSNKNRLQPPYALNTMLYKNPSFKTTNISDYTNNLGIKKYANIKSKYKNIPILNESAGLNHLTKICL